MAPAFYATALVHGVRGDDTERGRWWELGEAVCWQATTNSFSAFAEPRIALHMGDVERAQASLSSRTSQTAGRYQAYVAAIAVEVAVIAGAPDAEQQLVGAAGLAAENDFVAALLLRAAGRLHHDEAELLAAIAQWEAIGARFERACTLLLLPSREDEGRAELAALGCPAPPA
jgi:hypothetical protein